MKKTIVFIILLLILIAACVYYNCIQEQKFEQEKKEAVAAAVLATIDSIDQRHALETPQQTVVAHKPPPPVSPPPETKKEVLKEVSASNMMTDARDGQQYKIFDANGRWWMGQNLNFGTKDSWCYDLDDTSCEDFGRLYTWNAAMTACPEGWHLPDDTEWLDLIIYHGGIHYAGKSLKVGGASEFNALMSGYRDKAGFYGKIDESAYYWSSTEQGETYASFKGIYLGVDNVGTYNYTKADGLSIRCVKN